MCKKNGFVFNVIIVDKVDVKGWMISVLNDWLLRVLIVFRWMIDIVYMKLFSIIYLLFVRI